MNSPASRTRAASRDSLDLLATFGGLQILDVLSTLACLLRGLPEGNPCIRWMMETAGSPLAGIFCVKMIALLFGFVCWRRGRLSLLRRATSAYAMVIGWNLTALAAAVILRAS